MCQTDSDLVDQTDNAIESYNGEEEPIVSSEMNGGFFPVHFDPWPN